MRCDAMRCDATRRDATRRDATRRDATRRDATRRDATRRDATRRDATRRDATRCDVHFSQMLHKHTHACFLIVIITMNTNRHITGQPTVTTASRRQCTHSAGYVLGHCLVIFRTSQYHSVISYNQRFAKLWDYATICGQNTVCCLVICK